MKIKKILCLITSLLLIFFAGCGNKKTENKGSINVLVDVKDSKSADIIQKLAQNYETKNPDVNVNITASIGTNAAEEIGKGNLDIIFTTRRNMVSLAGKGYLASMKSYFQDNKIDERHNKIIKYYGMYNDKEYGIPFNLSPLEVYYNTDALKKLNLSPPSDVQGLYNILSILKSKSVEIPVIIQDESYLNSVIFSFLVNNNVNVGEFDKVFGGGAEAYKNIDMKIPFNTLKDMVKRNVIGEYSFVKGTDTAATKLAKGEIPVLIASAVNINEINNGSVEVFNNFSGKTVPVASEGIISVPVNAKNGKQVESFIKYVLSDETQKNLVDMGYISSNKSVAKESKGLAASVNAQLSSADEKNIIYTDTIPENLVKSLETRLELILSGKFTENEWNEILKSAY